MYAISQPNHIHKPPGRWREIYRPPLGERQVIAGFIVVWRRSTELPAVTAGSLDDRRWDTGGTSAENLPVTEQSPGGDRQATTG